MNASVQRAMKAMSKTVLKSPVLKVEFGKIEFALISTNVSNLLKFAAPLKIPFVKTTTVVTTALVETIS